MDADFCRSWRFEITYDTSMPEFKENPHESLGNQESQNRVFHFQIPQNKASNLLYFD